MKVLLTLSALVLLNTNALSGIESEKPNIVILLADDLGFGDVGFNGSDIQTPHLDQLAGDGVRLRQFYVAPMCSPTRAGLMTGRYPIRFGLMRAVIPPHRDFGLDPSEQTLAETLAHAGYRYRACIGKWHLGHLRKQWHPRSQGFTHFVGCYNGAIDYFTHEREGELDWHKNDVPFRVEGYSTDIIANEACGFIASVPDDEPYFLYVPFNAPHAPYQAKEADIAKYPNREGKRRTYAAMVDCMDQGIGKILAAINKRGDRENTFILFFSDNGGVRNIGDNSPLKGHKLTVFQGGIRVVAVAHWPNGGLSGGGVSRERMGYIDIHPTLADLVGAAGDPSRPFDGLNVLDAMRGKEELPDRPWFSYVDQGTQAIEWMAMNFDTRKVILRRPVGEGTTEPSTVRQLFHIDTDPREMVNLADQEKESLEDGLQQIEAMLGLRGSVQIDRYNVGRKGFKAPVDWVISDE